MNGISVMPFMEEKLTLAVPVVAGFRMTSLNIHHAKERILQNISIL